MRRLHLFVTFDYSLAQAIIFQVMANFVLVSFREPVVFAFLLFSFQNEAVWLQNLAATLNNYTQSTTISMGNNMILSPI